LLPPFLLPNSSLATPSFVFTPVKVFRQFPLFRPSPRTSPAPIFFFRHCFFCRRPPVSLRPGWVTLGSATTGEFVTFLGPSARFLQTGLLSVAFPFLGTFYVRFPHRTRYIHPLRQTFFSSPLLVNEAFWPRVSSSCQSPCVGLLHLHGTSTPFRHGPFPPPLSGTSSFEIGFFGSQVFLFDPSLPPRNGVFPLRPPPADACSSRVIVSGGLPFFSGRFHSGWQHPFLLGSNFKMR